MTDLRRLASVAYLAAGVLLLVRVGLVLARADGGLSGIVSLVAVLLLAGGSGLLGWSLAERYDPLWRAGAAAVAVMAGSTVVLVVIALVGELVAGGAILLAELGTLAVAVVAIVVGGLGVGRSQRW